MRPIISALLLLTFMLGACTSSPAPAATDSTQPPASTAESTPAENSEQASAEREAILSEVLNTVRARSLPIDEFAPAAAGMKINAGGGLQTGRDGKARLDLLPEGTILRIGPNSSFTVPAITEANGEAKTTLELFFGKVYVLLKGGSLEVKTPSGIASVRGSLLSVQYNPKTNRMRASCLEGHCALENEAGEELELIEGQSAYIDEEDDLSGVEEIDRDEIFFWLEDNPDLLDFLDEYPDPEDYPDFDDDEWYDFDYSEEDFADEEWYDEYEFGGDDFYYFEDEEEFEEGFSEDDDYEEDFGEDDGYEEGFDDSGGDVVGEE
jgi:hypothetical protein